MTYDQLSPEDRAHLDWARTIARRGWGRVHPNPMVGCVLVKDGRVVGEGYHREFGGPHAEIVALEEAGTNAEGATAYVSLEPCDHDGKTPPCSMALADARVRRVVFGVAEPGSEEGGGADTLRTRGIDVVGPVWGPEVGQAENPAFHHTSRSSTPFVALKLAVTLDGKISESEGARTRITGTDAEREVHRLRTGFDGVLVGTGTCRADDPRLTVRLVPEGHRPVRRLLLDPRAGLPSDAAVFADADSSPLHVFTWQNASEEEMERLEAAGAHVHPVPGTESRLDLEAVLSVVWELGVRSVLCEGGARLAASLLDEDRVSRLYVFIAPHTLGTDALSGFLGSSDLKAAEFTPAQPAQTFGQDTLLVLDRRKR